MRYAITRRRRGTGRRRHISKPKLTGNTAHRCRDWRVLQPLTQQLRNNSQSAAPSKVTVNIFDPPPGFTGHGVIVEVGRSAVGRHSTWAPDRRPDVGGRAAKFGMNGRAFAPFSASGVMLQRWSACREHGLSSRYVANIGSLTARVLEECASRCRRAAAQVITVPLTTLKRSLLSTSNDSSRRLIIRRRSQ